MAATKRRLTKDEVARLGDAIYDRDVRPHLKPEDDGKFVAIDVETGAHEIADDELAALDRLRARVPKATMWLVKVGSPYVYRFGGHGLRGES